MIRNAGIVETAGWTMLHFCFMLDMTFSPLCCRWSGVAYMIPDFFSPFPLDRAHFWKANIGSGCS